MLWMRALRARVLGPVNGILWPFCQIPDETIALPRERDADMNMTTGMILDVVVIVLLMPTIVYAVILNRRLAALRRSREELSKVVNSFNEATMRAEAGIPKLKKATTEANHTLKERVDKAQTLRDDLAFMIERAEELAARLEGAVRAARAEGVPAAPAPAANSYPAAAPPRTVAAGIGGAMGEAPARPQAAPAGTLSAVTLAQTAAGFEETAAELRNALGAARAEARMSGVSGSMGPMAGGIGAARAKRALGPERGQATPEPGLDEERSEAERELLKALQSAR